MYLMSYLLTSSLTQALSKFRCGFLVWTKYLFILKLKLFEISLEKSTIRVLMYLFSGLFVTKRETGVTTLDTSHLLSYTSL